jgi:hypothetical protein
LEWAQHTLILASHYYFYFPSSPTAQLLAIATKSPGPYENLHVLSLQLVWSCLQFKRVLSPTINCIPKQKLWVNSVKVSTLQFVAIICSPMRYEFQPWERLLEASLVTLTKRYGLRKAKSKFPVHFYEHERADQAKFTAL